MPGPSCYEIALLPAKEIVEAEFNNVEIGIRFGVNGKDAERCARLAFIAKIDEVIFSLD